MLELVIACRRSRQRPNRGRRLVKTVMADGTFMAVCRSQCDYRGKFESIGGSAARWRSDIPPLKQAILHVANNGFFVAVGNRRGFREGNFPWKVQTLNEPRFFCALPPVNGLHRAAYREARLEIGRDSLHGAHEVYVTTYTTSTASSIGFADNAELAQNRCRPCTPRLIFDLNECLIVQAHGSKTFCDGDDRDRPRE